MCSSGLPEVTLKGGSLGKLHDAKCQQEKTGPFLILNLSREIQTQRGWLGPLRSPGAVRMTSSPASSWCLLRSAESKDFISLK